MKQKIMLKRFESSREFPDFARLVFGHSVVEVWGKAL